MSTTSEQDEEAPILWRDRSVLDDQPLPALEPLRISDGLLAAPLFSEPILRKPALPPRSSRKSLDKRSYDVIEMSDIEAGDMTKDSSDAGNARRPAAPKSFQKTHNFFGLNFGYWRMPARHFSIFSILAVVIIVPLYYASLGFDTINSSDFDPFSRDCEHISDGWTFVGINMIVGKFNYGSAKALDLAWNWVVGRGLQFILSLICYRVFSDALLRAAELAPLSFELYASLSFYATKPEILYQVLKGLKKYGGWRAKAIFVWIFISTIYLVLFPSLLDACSGYETSYTSKFRWPNGTSQSVVDFRSWKTNQTIVNSTKIYVEYWEYSNNTRYNFSYVDPSTVPANSSWKYYYSWGESVLIGNVTRFRQMNEWELLYWTDTTLNKSWWDHFEADPFTSQRMYWNSWGFWPSDPDHFDCLTESNLYSWGFSFEFLFVSAVLNSCILFGLWVLWLDCDTNSEFCKKRRRLGLWRAVADISEAMREELGPNICAYSEEELSEALKKRPPIKYYVKQGTADRPGHIGLSTRPSGSFRLRWNQEYGKKNE